MFDNIITVDVQAIYRNLLIYLLLRNFSNHLFYKHLRKPASAPRTKKDFPNLDILKCQEKKVFNRMLKVSENL